MDERPSITKWEFKKEVECFNCHKVAVQRVEIIPTETIVTCENCGAERYYVIHGFFVAGKRPDFEADRARRKYDLWSFTRSAKCANCSDQTEHEITLDEFKIAVVCPSCLFTHIYKFSVYSVPGLER
jgi:Zn finger protein HypA/HybF involved in hydrogenase expression